MANEAKCGLINGLAADCCFVTRQKCVIRGCAWQMNLSMLYDCEFDDIVLEYFERFLFYIFHFIPIYFYYYFYLYAPILFTDTTRQQ